MRYVRPAVPAEAEPLNQLNMTPLIDVMLVLIIMLIVTIPKANHSVGMDMPTLPAGTISKMGIKASYIYDEASAPLTVTVHDKPMFISCSMIENRIRYAVKMLQGTFVNKKREGKPPLCHLPRSAAHRQPGATPESGGFGGRSCRVPSRRRSANRR